MCDEAQKQVQRCKSRKLSVRSVTICLKNTSPLFNEFAARCHSIADAVR